jgi:hypothetical protein
MDDSAKALGLSITTLQRWERQSKLVAEPTVGVHRRYNLAKRRQELFLPRRHDVAAFLWINEGEGVNHLAKTALFQA